MNCLVTGGSGFIGSHVCEKLLKEGHTVTVYDKMPLRIAPHPKLKFVCGDVLDSSLLNIVMKDKDFVFHLAAVSNTLDCVKFPSEAVEINCLGTARVLEAAYNVAKPMEHAKRSVNRPGVQTFPRVIVASSSLISGVLAQGAGNDFLVDVSSCYHIYVSSKLYEEMLARDFNRMYGLPYTALRFGICYGPRMTPGVVADVFIKRALACKSLPMEDGGKQWRQYIYVEDLADAIVACIDPKAENQTYNIVRPEKVSIIDMAEAIKTCIPDTVLEVAPARSHDIDVELLPADNLIADLGWESKTDLVTGMRRTISWYQDHMED